jgi:hypothetical protein
LGIPVSEIAVGKCYVTELGQIRRVLKLSNRRVTYVSRGAMGSWGRENSVPDGRFARDVEREVPCPSNPAIHQLDSDRE